MLRDASLIKLEVGITLALECDKNLPQNTLGLFCNPENDVWTFESGDFRRQPHHVMFGGLHNARIIYCLSSLSPSSLVFQVPASYSRATLVEEMGLKACETCQASCGGSVSRGLNYRIRGLFEIFFNCQIVILLFAGRATRARFSKNNQTCRLFHGGVDHQFSGSHPSSWKISLQCKEPKILAAAVLLVGCTARPRGMDVSSE